MARAIRAESSDAASGAAINFARSEPVWLPTPGMRLYRDLRRLLRQARAEADGRAIKLSVLDLLGKSHVEVTATVSSGRSTRVLACSFPRHAAGMLGQGFAETLDLG